MIGGTVDPEMAMALAVGMLENAKFKYEVRSDREEIWVPFGSAAVYIQAESATVEGHTYLTFQVPLVQDLRITKQSSLKILSWLNQQNLQSRGFRFALTPQEPSSEGTANRSAVEMRFEVLAEHLQEEELVHAVRWLGTQADLLDDKFIEEFGGSNHQQSMRASKAVNTSKDGAGVDI